jgi:hypothetical protein
MERNDPLPSWRPGSTRDALEAFLAAAEEVPVVDRVAYFDNDGTLWCERPSYVQLDFFLDALRKHVAEDPSIGERAEFAALLSGDQAAIAGIGLEHIALALAGLFEGMTPEAFASAARQFMASAAHPTATTIATSDGQMFRAPRMGKREQAKLARLEREKARRGKGSARRKVVVARIAALHQTVADRRRDWVEKITTRVAANYDVVAVEQLPIRNMVRRPKPKPDPDNPGQYLPNGAAAKAGLNKGIYANCWGLFAKRLGQKMKACGTTLVEVPARYSSQQCRKCGHTAKENRQSQTVFLCVACGHGDHADHNAAQIVLARALPAPTPGPGAAPQGAGTARCAHENENSGWAA